MDEIIELYKKDVDRTLLRANLRLSVKERLQKTASAARAAALLRGATRLREPGRENGTRGNA